MLLKSLWSFSCCGKRDEMGWMWNWESHLSWHEKTRFSQNLLLHFIVKSEFWKRFQWVSWSLAGKRLGKSFWSPFLWASQKSNYEISSKVDPLFSSNWSTTDWISSKFLSGSDTTLQNALFSSVNFYHNLQTSLSLTTSFVFKVLKVVRIVSEGKTSLMDLSLDTTGIFVD